MDEKWRVEVAGAMVEAKMEDEERRKKEVRQHPDCPGREACCLHVMRFNSYSYVGILVAYNSGHVRIWFSICASPTTPSRIAKTTSSKLC